MEILIKTATVIDGTGTVRYTGDVGISNGRIVYRDGKLTGENRANC